MKLINFKYRWIWLAFLIGVIVLSNYWNEDLGIGLGVLEVFGIGIAIPFLISTLIVREELKSIRIFNNHYV